MADTPKTVPLHVQVNQDELKRLGRGLSAALNQLAEEFRVRQARREEALEVAALFGLHRQVRQLDGVSGEAADVRQAELRAQMTAAINGYDVVYLAELATFGDWLHETAQRAWRAR